MFNSLSDRLSITFKQLRGKGRITESDLDETIQEIRIAPVDQQDKVWCAYEMTVLASWHGDCSDVMVCYARRVDVTYARDAII